jgi:hypothetical protein
MNTLRIFWRLGSFWGILLLAGSTSSRAAEPATDWTQAERLPPFTAAQTQDFMRRLLAYVEAHHLRREEGAPQRGMVYEYFDTRRAGQFDQWVQGEALDTMHDGAWLAAALVSAYRATGDRRYKEFLTRWQLPFYCQMLNHSDRLFSARRNDARPGAPPFGKEHALQEGEKGFVPYWWDNGASVSLERRKDRNPLGPYPCTDHLAGKPNPKYLLDGYSHGSSNHLAQDLGVMLQLAWLLLRESSDPGERRLAQEVAEAAANLHQCRLRHHGFIPMCAAPAGLAQNRADYLRQLPNQSDWKTLRLDNHYYRALYDFVPGRRAPFPAFADDQEYRYYFGLARHGGQLPPPLAFKTIYDAYTEPLLYRYYCDDVPAPAGVNRFDLYPYYAQDGRLLDYRSDRKGPGGRPRPIGSRFGPQNLVCCGWALQALRCSPGIWEEFGRRHFPHDLRVYVDDRLPRTALPPAPWGSLPGKDFSLQLRSSRHALYLRGSLPATTLTIMIFRRPQAQDLAARLTVTPQGNVMLVNASGETLSSRFSLSATGSPRSWQLEIPYMICKGQKSWLNGVELGRYSLRVAQDVYNFYLLSPENQVQERLRQELAGGLRNWEALFRQRGYIPTGLGTGTDWDYFSDTGGYAHLLQACAQWLFLLAGKNDWEEQHLPRVWP